MPLFEKTVEIRWSDVDQNRHVRHSAYYDFGAFVRIKCLEEAGFGAKEMEDGNLGPILFKEECSFIREIKPEDVIRINMLKGELSADGSRWTIHHEMHNQNDQKVAHITVHGAWMDTVKRRLTIPTTQLAHVFEELLNGENYSRN